MIVQNVTVEDMERALAKANKAYRGNLKFKSGLVESGKRVKRINFRLGVKGTAPQGDAPTGSRLSPTGRRIAAACWHAHRDFMQALFDLRPEALLTSCKARYNGLDDFEMKFERTGYDNIGLGVRYRDACDCTEVE